MKFTASQIALLIDGNIEGNENATVNGFSKIDDSKPETLSFLANPQYEKYIYSTLAEIVIVGDNFIPSQNISATLIKVENPYAAFARLLQEYEKLKKQAPGIANLASIAENAEIGNEVYIADFAFVGNNSKVSDNVRIFPNVYIGNNVEIGENTTLHPGVKVYDDCKIGSNCNIHAGAVIGSDGFGFAPNNAGVYDKIPQIGNVVIEDNVEIGSNTCIDRATMGSTFIRNGVKLDNLIQVAHNVDIGENTVIASQSGIAGSTKVGKNCMFGGQVGLINHIEIADEVKIAAQSGIGKDVKINGMVLQGSPAYKITDYQKSQVLIRKLPELQREINRLRKELDKLSGSSE